MAGCRRLLLLAVWVCIPMLAAAEEEAGWVAQEQVRARLVFGDYARYEHSGDGQRWLVAGLQFRLQPGWHLTWRNPGDTGSALQYKTAGSSNVADLKLHWPAPRRFVEQQGLEIFGYENDVVLPITAKVEDASKPVNLSLQLYLSVCQAVCRPSSLAVTMDVPADAVADSDALQLITQFSQRVPKEAKDGMAYEIVWEEEGAQKGVLRVNVRTRDMYFTVPDLFVEGPEGIRFPRPRTVLDGDRKGAGFTVPYELSLPGVSLGGQSLTLTLVNGYEAVETTTALPAHPSANSN